MKIILASGSPRRRELLGNLGLDFDIIVDNSEEEMISGEEPKETVMRLALQKAKNVAEKCEDNSIIIAADTVVSIDNMILGKPKDNEDAVKMLKSLSGREHNVYTGLAVINTGGDKVVNEYEMTKVVFKELSDDEISTYVNSGEPLDKAGSYGIQNLGALFIEGIIGDYFNVVGLPLCKLGKILKSEFGFNILR